MCLAVGLSDPDLVRSVLAARLTRRSRGPRTWIGLLMACRTGVLQAV